MSEIEDLITKMKEVKTLHPNMEYQDILKIFNIQTLQNLTKELRGLRFKKW